MTIPTLLIAVFLAATAYGAYRSEVELRSRNAHHSYTDMLFEWTDHLPAGPRNEGLIWFAPAVHFVALTIIALTTLMLISRQTAVSDLFSSSGFAAGYLHVIVVSMCTSLIAYLWGALLPVNPIYKPFRRQAHLGLSAEGILYAGRLFPWNTFTHFTVSEPGGVIRLWSASSPRLVLFPLRPANAEDRYMLIETLSHYLPTSAPTPGQYSWPGWFLPAIMVGTSAAAVVIAWLLLLNGGIVGLPATAVLMFLFAIFGGRMIMYVGFGGMGRPAKLQDDSAV